MAKLQTGGVNNVVKMCSKIKVRWKCLPSNSSTEEKRYVGEYHYAVCVLSLLYSVDVRNGKCMAHILWIKNERVKCDIGTAASKSIGLSLKSGTYPAKCRDGSYYNIQIASI